MTRLSTTNSFFNHNEEPKIPLLSQEAFNILSSSSVLKDISSIICKFNLLIKSNSVLRSHHRGNGPLNTQEFIDDLNALLNRLTEAVENEQPYSCLFGDILRLQQDLQVILGYYQAQLKAGLPDSKHHTASSSFKALMVSISHNEKPVLNDEESATIEKYVINNNAQSIMEEDISSISNIVLMSFLEDHSNDPTFSYF